MQRDRSVYYTFKYLSITFGAFFIFMTLLLGCTSSQTEKPNITTADTMTNNQPVVAKEESIAETITTPEEEKQEDDDCVFNNDYKEITTGWLKELNKTNFIWRADLEQALIPMGQDTVFLSQGGCVHFGFIVEWKLAHDNHLLSDSVYWVHKSLELATEYEMDHYSKMIQSGKIRAAQQGETAVWYEVDDNIPDDNLFYTGIEIRVEGTSKRIRIAQYFN